MRLNKIGGVIGIIFLIILLFLLGASIYLLYLNLPSEPKEFGEFDVNGNELPLRINYSSSTQFFDNLRFSDSKIGYRIEAACDSKKTAEVEEAFFILESKTIIDFYEDSMKPEIIIFCSDIEPEPEKDGYFVAGEGGPTEVINTSLYGVILSGKVSFFRDEKCDNPNIAIHEILHVLGFDHNNNPDSILYPTLDCDQEIDDSLINDINSLYSVKSASDLKIVEVNAVKAGRYLNFEIEVVNQGLREAGNIKLSIYSNNEFVKHFDLENIDVGTRKFLTVENLKISRSSTKISFILDEENKVDELFEENNRVDLMLIEE